MKCRTRKVSVPYCIVMIFGSVLLMLPSEVSSQMASKKGTDSVQVINTPAPNNIDSLLKLTDTILPTLRGKMQSASAMPLARINSVQQQYEIRRKKYSRKSIDSTSRAALLPFKKMITTHPLLRINGGSVHYQFNYRTAVDTPYYDKELSENQLHARLNFEVVGLPFQLNGWTRQSNSSYFKDITALQLVFNGQEFKGNMQTAMRQRLLSGVENLKDSIQDQLLKYQEAKLLNWKQWLTSAIQLQNFAEAYEILHVPKITYSHSLPDSVNEQRADSFKSKAQAILDIYDNMQKGYDSLNVYVDSLKKIQQATQSRINQLSKLISGQPLDYASLKRLGTEFKKEGLGKMQIPSKYKWLLGIRNFSLGRSNLNYSDLTANNLSINGVNFEYNSWYYLSLSAGTVDFRFRELFVSQPHKTSQYLMMLRTGIGRLEHNHVIATAYKGKKQLFPVINPAFRDGSINVSGVGIQTRLQLHRSAYLSAEIAQSFTPNYRNLRIETNNKRSWSDNSDKAYAIRFYSFQRKTNTKLEGSYKYTGAAFQSFNSFQTNAAMESWNIKAEQSIFKKSLRINFALRKNEFSNPYIIQQYSSNTVFKNISVTFRKRKLPVVSAGFMPMSQLTMMGDKLHENHFQSLTASVHHLYKVKKIRAASMGVVNKFYNNVADTGYLYYNALNLYASQTLFFQFFTATVAVAHSDNGTYRLNVFDEGVQLNVWKTASIGFGAKINQLNKTFIKVGGYLNGSIRISDHDMISFNLERGYLPRFQGGLVKNDMGSIQFIKHFRF